ncbi:unnamed protein product [Penicillium palitans]
MSAFETSGFARKSAMTTSLDRCVLYWMMHLGVLLSELAGSPLLLDPCPVAELHGRGRHCKVNLVVKCTLVLASWAKALYAFPLVWDSTDSWYSLADASGADDDGVPGSTASLSSRTYASSLARFCVLPVLSTDLSKPLFLVVIDDDVVARLGALRLGGSERVTGKRIDLWIPFSGCVDWRIDSLIASASALPIAPVVKPGIMVSSTTSSWASSWAPCISVSPNDASSSLLAGWPELGSVGGCEAVCMPSLDLCCVELSCVELSCAELSFEELCLVEALEPLPPELPDPTVTAAGVLPATIKRYAGTRWCLSLAYARACTLSISMMKSGHRFDHPLYAPPQLAHFRSLSVASFFRWQSRE